MAKDIGGSPQSVTLSGVTYDVPADVDLDFVRSKYKKEGVASTGRNMIKATRQVEEIKSVVVFANADEQAQLQALGESITDFTMAVKLIDGSVFRTTGQIDFEGWNSAELKAKMTLIPRTSWTPFVSP